MYLSTTERFLFYDILLFKSFDPLSLFAFPYGLIGDLELSIDDFTLLLLLFGFGCLSGIITLDISGIEMNDYELI